MGNDDLIKKHLRQLSDGESLFHQGDLGNSMFIVMSGVVELYESRDGKDIHFETFTQGEVLGEKAIIAKAPYRRAFTVRSKGESTLLEFDATNIKMVEALIPNFSTRILQLAAGRLDRANKLNRMLRSMDPAERIVDALKLLAETGQKNSEGILLSTTVERLWALTNVDQKTIEFCLKQLAARKAIKVNADSILLMDEDLLSQVLPEIQERLAA